MPDNEFWRTIFFRFQEIFSLISLVLRLLKQIVLFLQILIKVFGAIRENGFVLRYSFVLRVRGE